MYVTTLGKMRNSSTHKSFTVLRKEIFVALFAELGLLSNLLFLPYGKGYGIPHCNDKIFFLV
jgi:hypothetical protein